MKFQFRSRFHELRVFLALRPTNYIFGRIFRFKKIIYVPHLGYLVNDAEIARNILHDHDHFSIKEAGGLGDIISEIWGELPTLLSMDGDEHKKVKFTLLELFKTEKLDTILERELALFSETLLNRLNKKSEIDIVRETRLVTNLMTYKLLGVEPPSNQKILGISQLVTNAMNCVDIMHQSFTPENRKNVEKYATQLINVAKDICSRSDPKQDSLISRLRNLGYEDNKIYGFISMFIIAGTVTVSSSLPRILNSLIETNQLKYISDSVDNLDTILDEGLRYTTPGPLLLHGVKSDHIIDNYKFRANRRVMILLYNIMHSSKYTNNPFVYDVNRQQNKLINGLWFGTGAHFCMGSVLARTEISVALKTFAPFANELKIIRRTYMKNGINPGYDSLVIVRR